MTGQAADTHIQSPVTSESSNQPTEQKKVLAKSDAIKVKDIWPRKRERLVSAKVNKPKKEAIIKSMNNFVIISSSL